MEGLLVLIVMLLILIALQLDKLIKQKGLK